MNALNGHAKLKTVLVTTDVGTAFVRLVLGIEKYLPACLHSYWGPPGWLQVYENNPPSLEMLRADAVTVATAVQKSTLPTRRRERLLRQTRAVLWLIRARLGETIMFSEQVRMLLDVQPESVDNAFFQTAQETLAAALPDDLAGGTLAERWAGWQERYTIAAASALPHFNPILTHFHQEWQPLQLALSEQHTTLTYQQGILYLPASSGLRLDRLYHLAWNYGWQQAVYQAVHQGYERGETECAVLLNYGPQQLLAKGLPLAVTPNSDWYKKAIPDLLQAAGLPALPAEQLQAVHLAEDALQWADANAALLLHGEGLRPRAVRRYMMTNKLVDEAAASAQLDQLSDPIIAAHVFAPLIGGPLLYRWLSQEEESLTALLDDPPTPSAMLFKIRFGD